MKIHINKLKKIEDPINIERVVDLSGLTKYQWARRKNDDLVWYLTLCVLNWINVEYIITDENRLYINRKDINKDKMILPNITKKTSKSEKSNKNKDIPVKKTSKKSTKISNSKISNIKSIDNIDNINLGDLLSD